MPDMDIEALLERTGRRNFRCGRMTVRTLLTQIAELQGRVDYLAGQVAGKEATIQRVLDLAAELREHAARSDRDPVEHGISAAERFEAHVTEGVASLFVKAIDGDPADDGSQR